MTAKTNDLPKPLKQRRSREPRPATSYSRKLDIRDAIEIAEGKMPSRPEDVAKRVHHIMANPDQYGGVRAAALEALSEIVWARQKGWSWGHDGGQQADIPEAPSMDAVAVPFVIVAQIMSGWAEFSRLGERHVPTMDRAFGVAVRPGQKSFALQRHNFIQKMKRGLQVEDVRSRIATKASVGEIAEKIGISERTLGENHREYLRRAKRTEEEGQNQRRIRK